MNFAPRAAVNVVCRLSAFNFFGVGTRQRNTAKHGCGCGHGHK